VRRFPSLQRERLLGDGLAGPDDGDRRRREVDVGDSGSSLLFGQPASTAVCAGCVRTKKLGSPSWSGDGIVCVPVGVTRAGSDPEW